MSVVVLVVWKGLCFVPLCLFFGLVSGGFFSHFLKSDIYSCEFLTKWKTPLWKFLCLSRAWELRGILGWKGYSMFHGWENMQAFLKHCWVEIPTISWDCGGYDLAVGCCGHSLKTVTAAYTSVAQGLPVL